MNVKIWDGQQQEAQLKTPILKMEKNGDVVEIICVDEAGRWFNTLCVISKKGLNTIDSAKGVLEENNYDTFFTSWDSDGAIKIL